MNTCFYSIVKSQTIEVLTILRCKYGETGWIIIRRTTPYWHKRCEPSMLNILKTEWSARAFSIYRNGAFGVVQSQNERIWTNVWQSTSNDQMVWSVWIYMVATDLSLSIISRIFVQTQLVINGSDDVAFKVIVSSMNGKYA